MQYKPFGKIDFQTSIIGFGGAAVSGDAGGYGFGSISEKDAINLLHLARDRGINTFDTAPCYGFGESERRIGKAFQDCRKDVFLVSKSGVTWDENKRVRKSNDPQVTRSMLEQSLKDLKTDYIDLYMIHWPDDYFDIRDSMQVIVDAQKLGKVRFIGLCNTYDEDFKKASEIGHIDVIQNNFNLFDQEAKNRLFPLVQNHQLGFMGYGTLDKGILTGRVTPDRKYDKTDVRAVAKWWKAEDRAWKFAAMDQIKAKLTDWNITPLEMALHGSLFHNEVSTALVGAKSPEQLDGVIQAACREDITQEQITEIESIIENHRP